MRWTAAKPPSQARKSAPKDAFEALERLFSGEKSDDGSPKPASPPPADCKPLGEGVFVRRKK